MPHVRRDQRCPLNALQCTAVSPTTNSVIPPTESGGCETLCAPTSGHPGPSSLVIVGERPDSNNGSALQSLI